MEKRAEIKRVHKSTSALIIHFTNDQIEAMTLVRRIVLPKDGIVQQIGTPKQIYDCPDFFADFTGSPPMNLIPAEVLDHESRLGEQLLSLDMLDLSRLPTRVALGIRPEHLPRAKGDANLIAVPELVESTGAESYVAFRLGTTLTMVKPPRQISEESRETIPLSAYRSSLCFFGPETGTRLI